MQQTNEFLEMALAGFIEKGRRIQTAMDEITQQLSGAQKPAAPAAAALKPPRTRHMSKAARKRISEAQRNRWANYHKAKAASAAA